MVLDRAIENGFTIERAKVDAIYTGPTINAVSGLYKVEFQVSSREPEVKGFAPLPLRWRIEHGLGILTTRTRRLVRDWEQLPEVSETIMLVANLRRLIRAVARAT